MGKGRLEAFSDGVLAIIITLMALELHVPHEPTFEALRPTIPVFGGYILSFTYIGIYWNNHHHLIHHVKKIDARIMWANLHLLFWLSLLPVLTGWVGEHPRAAAPAAIYGGVLMMAAIAYLILQNLIVKLPNDWKGVVSPLLYLAGIAGAFVTPWLSEACYATVAILWFIPDRRLARDPA